MIISVFGETDKRPVIYTLMSMLTVLGDVWVVSNDRHYRRLIDDMDESKLPQRHVKETEGKPKKGSIQQQEVGDIVEETYLNILVTVADTTEDEVYSDLQHLPDDFDYIIFDNLVPEDADLVIYVKGEGTSETESEVLELLDNYETIQFGSGKGAIRYSAKMMQMMEHAEYAKELKEIDANITKVLAKLLADKTQTPEATLTKVVKR